MISTKAVDLLREKGLSAAANKAGRIATEGIVESYIHAGGRIGVLVEINCETDFVGKTDQFREFASDIAMQIAAANPKFVSREEVSQEELDKEREILKAQALTKASQRKSLRKWLKAVSANTMKNICLLEQPFIKDPDKTITHYLTKKSHNW